MKKTTYVFLSFLLWTIGFNAWAQHEHDFVNGICTYDDCLPPAKYQEPTKAEDGFYELRNAGNVEWISYMVRESSTFGLDPYCRLMNDIAGACGLREAEVRRVVQGAARGGGRVHPRDRRRVPRSRVLRHGEGHEVRHDPQDGGQEVRRRDSERPRRAAGEQPVQQGLFRRGFRGHPVLGGFGDGRRRLRVRGEDGEAGDARGEGRPLRGRHRRNTTQ